MFSVFPFGGSLRLLSVRHLLCLLVALTFLYNPFLGASSSAPWPSISHPPSFRATVASSELLKFKPKDHGEIQVVQSDYVVLLAVAIATDLDDSARAEIAAAPIFVQYLSVGNLWFRPPPVV